MKQKKAIPAVIDLAQIKNLPLDGFTRVRAAIFRRYSSSGAPRNDSQDRIYRFAGWYILNQPHNA